MTLHHTESENESEMLEAYARFRLDGCSKTLALAMLLELGYTPTAYVMTQIRVNDKYIFSFHTTSRTGHATSSKENPAVTYG
jgi:hypothetical protein